VNGERVGSGFFVSLAHHADGLWMAEMVLDRTQNDHGFLHVTQLP
jgi:hypothetical protein